MSGHNGPKLTTKNLILNLDTIKNDSWNIGRSEWYDNSIYKNKGFLIGSPTISNVDGDISFVSGQDQYVSVPDVFFNVAGPNSGFREEDFTVEVWVYPQSFSTILHVVGFPDDTEFAIKAQSTTGNLFFVANGFNTSSTITGWSLTLNQWNCIAFKREGTTAYAYLNGVLIGSATGLTNNFTDGNLTIRKGKVGEFAPAKFRVVRVYDRALTAHEISQNFQAFRQRVYLPLISKPLSATQVTIEVTPTIGRFFSVTPILGIGGNGLYFYKFSAGTPPPNGVTINNLTGEVSILVNTIVSQTLTVQIADALNNTASGTFNLRVLAEPIVTTVNIPNFEVGINQEVDNIPVAGSGGFGTLTYSISPALPLNQQPTETFEYDVTTNGDVEYLFLGPSSGPNINISIIQGTTLEFDVNALGLSAGQAEYTTPGTYSWTAPTGVTSVSVVCVGAGAPGQNSPEAAGGGGGLGWKNNIPVVPGQSYQVVVGAGASSTSAAVGQVGSSYFINQTTVAGLGGSSNRTGGGFAGDGGGNGGQGGQGLGDGIEPGGGGAGGYTGNGGQGAQTNSNSTSGNGGAGGGGGFGNQTGGGGGGVGILGAGASGAGGANEVNQYGQGGGGGSGGAVGGGGTNTVAGGAYGGGSYGRFGNGGTSIGAGGAVRIIWGPSRAFPATNTQNQQPNSSTTQNFWIKTTQTSGTGDAVAGVVNNGTSNGIVTWNTSSVTPGVYYYVSENSASMTGIILVNPVPQSLTFNTTSGRITGKPIQPYTLTEHIVTITDQRTPSNQQASASFGLSVVVQPLGIVVIEPSIVALIDEPINVRPITATGGFGSYLYTISSTLPTGLSFNTATGVISGTPTVLTSATQYAITIQDVVGSTVLGNFTIAVDAPSGAGPVEFILEATQEGRTPGTFTITDTYSNTNVQNNFGFPGYYKITIPSAGVYEITVRGCNGTFVGVSSSTPENFGAEIKAQVNLNVGDELICVAGQIGLGTTSDAQGAGGGGGSFVAIGSTVAAAQPLVVAGGGGGSCFSRSGQENARGYANLGTVGRAGQTSGYSAEGHGWAVGGGGLANSTSGFNIAAWNGGGFFSDGGPGTNVRSGGTNGLGFINGLTGGLNESATNGGGFGGGGGGANNCGYGGGAGGYSGGGPGGYTGGCGGHGGGGGSYVTPTGSLVSSANVNNRFGYIKIVLI